VRVWQNVSYANFNGKAGGTTTAPFYVTSVQAVSLSPSAHNVVVYAAGAAPGNASQQASVTTAPGAARTTVVIADKVYGVAPVALQAIPFTEPALSAPPSLSDNVVIHHAAPSGGPGILAFGRLSLESTPSGQLIKTQCLGNLTFANPPIASSIKVLRLVNSGGAPIGFYVANSGITACRQPIADFFPGTAATPSPPPSLGGYPNSGVVYPTPVPSPPGQPIVPPLDCDSTLPPTCNGIPSDVLATLPNLSLYAIDSPVSTTTATIAILGVFDSNTQ
jgi:hypothetical protein